MCFIVNGMSSVRESLNTTFPKLYLMQTSRKQISMFTEEEFQSCQAASLVNPTQVLESDSERRTNATCGPKCVEQLERFNHVGSWAKMFSALLIGQEGWYSKRCKLTWRLKGTKSNRLYFQLQASTLPTEGIESGLLPTEMLPTPLASEIHHPERVQKLKDKGAKGLREREKGESGANGLTDYLDFHGMLPTPMAQEADKITGKENQNSVTKVIRSQTGTTSQLNPPFVAEMMGFPTDWTILPFLSGETNQ